MSAREIALFVAGAHKAGTTALYRALAQHPGLASHAQSELSVFVQDDEFARGLARAERRYFPRAGDRRPFVAKHVKLAQRRVALERLHAHSPGVHLVLVLRHPVERAYSAFWHARAHGREELAGFEQALAAEEPRIAAGRAPWHDTAYVRNGLFAAALTDAFELFGRERVHVFLSDELRVRGPELVRELYRELGVDPSVEPDLERGANRATAPRSAVLARWMGRAFDGTSPAKRALRALLSERVALGLRHGLVRWNTRPFAPPPLAAATRAALLARFRESNARVAALLGRDLAHWER
jgi:hypothetical protein